MLQMRVMLDPSEILRVQAMEPDPWQREFLLCEDRAQMLCCCLGAGKSRTTAAKATHRALFRKKSLILLISRAQRQAGELFRYVKEAYRAIKGADALDDSHKAVKWTETQLELANGSRIVCRKTVQKTENGENGDTLLKGLSHN